MTKVSGSKPQLDSLTFSSVTSYSLLYTYIFFPGDKNEWFYCKSKASPSSIIIFSLIPLQYANNSLKSCCSVAQSRLTLCDPMDCSTPGFYLKIEGHKFRWKNLMIVFSSNYKTNNVFIARSKQQQERSHLKQQHEKWTLIFIYVYIYTYMSIYIYTLTIWHHVYFRTRNFFFFWLCCIACGIFIPWPRIESMPTAVVAWSLNHWTTREAPEPAFLN